MAPTACPLTILLMLTSVHHFSPLPVSSRPYHSSNSLREHAKRQSTNWNLPDGVNVSKFILSVYDDIVTRPTSNENQPQPNIVRSINALPGSGASCDEFYFNLTTINGREVVFRADFRITLGFNRKFNGIWPAVYAVQDLDSSILPYNRITNNSGDSYSLIVNVDQLVTGWVFNIDTIPSKMKGFRLVFFNTPMDYYNKNPINACTGSSPITFVASSMDDHPALVIYSRDPDASLFAARALLKSLSDPDSAVSRDVERHARSSAGCGLNSLVFQASTLNSIPLIANQQIMFPSSYNGGICGGPCYGSYPDKNAPAIALIAHYITRMASAGYTQCCAPVQFGSVSFVSTPTGTSSGTTTITTLANMVVTDCTCLDITSN